MFLLTVAPGSGWKIQDLGSRLLATWSHKQAPEILDSGSSWKQDPGVRILKGTASGYRGEYYQKDHEYVFVVFSASTALSRRQVCSYMFLDPPGAQSSRNRKV